MKNILLAVMLAAAPAAAQEFAGDMPAMRDILAKTRALKVSSAIKKENISLHAMIESDIRTLSALIESESDNAKQLTLYKLKDQMQRTLNEVADSISEPAPGGCSNTDTAKLDQIMAEAKILNKLLASYLGTPDFAGTFHMKEQPFELEIKADAIYAGVLKKLPFLGGAIQGHVRINPGAEMVSQFNSLKAEYYMTLLDAAQVLKNAGKDPMDDRRLKGMAEWGRNMKVIAPGTGWMGATEILTWDQYNSLAR